MNPNEEDLLEAGRLPPPGRRSPATVTATTPLRYWQVERFVLGSWLTTDFRVGGLDEARAMARACSINPWGLGCVRLGREVRPDDHYCDFAWVNAS